MTRSATAWRSDLDGGSAEPRRQRAEGRVELVVRQTGGHTVLVRAAESGSARVRLPRGAGPGATAVLVNTAGGLAAGDRFATRIDVGAASDLTLATPAAEKVYRSEGDTTRAEVALNVGSGARLSWLPQETILYDNARLARRIDVEMAADASLLVFEAVVFGRAAHDERVVQGFYEDRWRIRRDGRLVYADTLRLSGAVSEQLAKPGVAAGARALATLLWIAPAAASRLNDARALLDGAGCECAAASWNGLLAVRYLAHDIATLRTDAARVITWLSGRPLPRVWHL